MSTQFAIDGVLPWHVGAAEDQLFRKLLIHAAGVLTVVAVLFPFLPTVDKPALVQDRDKNQYTRLIIEERPLPPPPVVKPEKKPIVPKIEKPKPKTKPKVIEKVAPKPKTKPVDLMKQARDTAAKSGVLAFADDLAAMRDQVDLRAVSRSNLSRGASQAERTERKILSAKATSAVGGISNASLSRDTGGVALDSRETTRIDAPTGNPDATEIVAAASEQQDFSGRSADSVRRVMDGNKGAIYAIYNRALRVDPTLAGKLLFTMVIETDGSISDVSVVSSDLADTALVQKIMSRIRLINFGSEPVEQTTVNYSFDFLPY